MENLNNNQKIILIIIVLLVFSVIGIYIWKQSNKEINYDNIDIIENTSNKIENTLKEIIPDEKNTIIVHITGSIVKPGIVEVLEGQRIDDAIKAAGGLLKEADMSKINLAYVLEDGQKIYIPSINDKEEKEYITQSAGEKVLIEEQNYEKTQNNKNNQISIVNINNATQTELETLPGIGPSTALKIIEYRKQNGKFNSIEDIKNVSGIGEAKFNNMKNYICIK